LAREDTPLACAPLFSEIQEEDSAGEGEINMARSRRSLKSACVPAGLTRRASLQWMLGLGCVIGLAAASLPRESAAEPAPGKDAGRSGIGGSSAAPQNGSLLVEYFTTFVADRDVEAFQNRVSARYTEGMLGRIVWGSPDPAARRAGVLALGLLGSFEHSNAVLGTALRDPDLVVRTLAEDSLWSMWYRAGTPEQNRVLGQVRLAISRQQFDLAEREANRLIEASPNFAEAYNQRAIIYFCQGRFAESVRDCQSVLARNPYHFGAVSGMAQCQLQLERPRDALKSLRRALRLQPYRTSLRDDIRVLELQGVESDATP
jgi:tetratricopeptide (TPR) repeat protein